MKTTKVKIVKAVKAVMDANKNISVKEICEKTGLSKTQVYSARHQLKTASKTKKKLTPVNKKAIARPINLHNEIIRLETNLGEMQRLVMYWKQAYHELEAKTRGNEAVVKYLEGKIIQLIGD